MIEKRVAGIGGMKTCALIPGWGALGYLGLPLIGSTIAHLLWKLDFSDRSGSPGGGTRAALQQCGQSTAADCQVTGTHPVE